MITAPYPTSNTNPALSHSECRCFKLGLGCSWDGHYTGRTNTTFSLDQSNDQASQGPNRGAINDKLDETDHHPIHPPKYQNQQQINLLAQDVCFAPSAELDAPPTSVRHLGNQASEGDDHRAAFYVENNGVMLQDIDMHPVAGGHVLAPGSYDGGFVYDVQGHRSYMDTKALDNQGSPQSLQPGGYDGMQTGSTLAGSPGSEYSAPFDRFPLRNGNWNNDIGNTDQGVYGTRLHAEGDFVDLGITTDPKNPRDDIVHWPNSMAACHESASEWNSPPQVQSSGKRTLPPHQGEGKKQIPDSRIPYNFDVAFRRHSCTTLNSESKSNGNIHIQQRSRHHFAVPTTTSAQDMGRNISIPTGFANYPVDGHQIQCIPPSLVVLRSTGFRNLTRCCGADHQTSPCSAETELTNRSTALGYPWQEKSGPSIHVALPNDATIDPGMVGEPPAPHVASTSSPIGNRGHLLGSSEAFTIKCRWRDEDKRVCGQWVTKETCAAHLASVHGIRGIPSDREILCRACCPPRIIKRESILRHFVEVHIGVKRKPTSGKGKKDRNHWAPSSHPGAGG